MRSPRALVLLAVAFVFATPTQAFAAESVAVVPDWLSILFAGIGLLTALILLIDAILLRRVAEGSVVAENIQYLMLAVVLLGISTVGRWIVTMTEDNILSVQVAFTADLLVIAGMALLAIYFYRVRRALTKFLDVLQHDVDAPSEPAATTDSHGGDGADG
jgi:glucose uptake protein GlcU